MIKHHTFHHLLGIVGNELIENQFLSAAKKWASYDKTPYISPFARDSWKRTHRKFNYSRFLNYTRETFV